MQQPESFSRLYFEPWVQVEALSWVCNLESLVHLSLAEDSGREPSETSTLVDP